MSDQISALAASFVDEWRGAYHLSNDSRRITADELLPLYRQTYWANNRAFEVIQKSIVHSLCYLVRHEGVPVGFLRLVTDYAVYAYLCDVIIDEAHRKKGLSKWMLQVALDHPDIKNLRRISLITRDAQTLYEPFGFTYLEDSRRYMEKMNLGV